jgi:general nucleoside transport system permease protein
MNKLTSFVKKLPWWVMSLAVLVVLAIARSVSGATVLTGPSVFGTSLGLACPIGCAALGGLLSERAGVVNIGLEGMMTLGMWTAGMAGWHFGPWAALLGGIIGGMLGGALHALATVTFGVDHTVSGVAINLLAPGITRYLSTRFFAGRGDGSITNSPSFSSLMGNFTMPFLSGGRIGSWRTPDFLGWLELGGSRTQGRPRKRFFFISDVAGILKGFTTQIRWSTLVIVTLFPVVVYLLWRTRWGLRLRSAGEKASAAESLGVNVLRTKWTAVVLSGGLAGLGGAWLAVDAARYSQGGVAGRGFLGIAALIFGNWKPVGIALGAVLFSFVQAVTFQDGSDPARALFLMGGVVAFIFAVRAAVQRQVRPAAFAAVAAGLLATFFIVTKTVNEKLVSMLPYLIVLVVVTFSSSRLRPPAEAGRPWRKGSS